MATVFDDLLLKGVRQGQLPARTQQSREWFRNQARTSSVKGDKGASQIVRDKSRFTNRATLGGMYFFFYDPKTKAKLPYYDRFPLIFKVGQSRGSFDGINMHYLPYRLRARLMDALYETSSNQRYDESTRLKLNYNVLKAATKYKEFKPTYKKYLTSNVRSRFIEINATEWDIALFLPVERFEKASKSTVWRDSRNAI
jgi:hypothetical protein|tara:strand:- start:3163 stop:3756 length:594 start_codon:yes stop_codon:yes gene_type:complete